MLKQAQATLDNHVLEDRSRGDIDSLALGSDNDDGALEGDAPPKVHGTSNGQMVKLDDLGNAGNALLEVGHLLEVATELDEGRIAKTARAHL